MLTVIWGTPLLRVLRYFRVGKAIRIDGPERHFTKLGTPTMGGVLIILPVSLITILLNASNLVGMKVLPSVGANVYDILHGDTLVLTKSAVAALEERLA